MGGAGPWVGTHGYLCASPTGFRREGADGETIRQWDNEMREVEELCDEVGTRGGCARRRLGDKPPYLGLGLVRGGADFTAGAGGGVVAGVSGWGLRKAVAALVPRCATALQMGGGGVPTNNYG